MSSNRLSRPLGVIATTAAAAITWFVVSRIVGEHLLVRFPGGPVQSIGIASVVGATVMGSLVGWGLLVVLERSVERPRLKWTVVALAAATLSLLLPLATATSTSALLGLVAMHLVVAAVLVTVLRGGSKDAEVPVSAEISR